MKLVIEISEEDYAETMYRKEHSSREMDWADRVIANGTSLEDYIFPFNDEKYKKGVADADRKNNAINSRSGY